MLDEQEWQVMEPALQRAIEDVKQFRQLHGVGLAEAKSQGFGLAALRLYRELTGFAEPNPDAIWHHRIAIYGPPCARCDKPLRTPQARVCAYCGAAVGCSIER
jgi:hypothetical protein